VAAHPDKFAGTELDPVTSRKRKEKLLAKVEKMAANQKGPATTVNPEDMAAKLRAALADRALGGILSKTDSRVVEEGVREAEESWKRLGPVPGDEGRELEERFRSACRRALGKKDRPKKDKKAAGQA
jgi:hypothetical protein